MEARLADELASPGEMLRGQLDWAVAHDQLARVQLLAEHGVDILTPDGDGHTPVEVAALCGNTAIVEYLLARGAPAPKLDTVNGLRAAVMAGDRGRALASPTPVIDELRAQPWLIVWAAARGRAAAVQLLLELGFDVNAFGRGDIPSKQQWQTALHTAAGEGHVDVVRVLVAAGADPNLHDKRFNETALGWANYGGHDTVVRILDPITEKPTTPLA